MNITTLAGIMQAGTYMSAFSGFIEKVPVVFEVSRERGTLFMLSFIIKGYTDAFLVSFNHVYSRIYSYVSNKPLIHMIGDSHTWAFKRNRQFIIHNIGPATAYNLANKDSSVRSNEHLFHVINGINKKRDLVVLVFGEIDCRVHIYNQFKKNSGSIPISAIIDRTIANYGIVLDQLSGLGVNFCVYGVLPASREVYRYTAYATARMRKIEFEEFQARYPYLADVRTRSRINKEFNERLKSYCADHGYRYIDIYAHVADPDGIIADQYVADEIHVNGRIMPFIKSWFKKEYGLLL